MKRKVGREIVCLGAALLLAGCAKEEGKTPPASIKIGVCVYDQYDTFIGMMVDEVKAAAKQKEMESGISFTVDVESAGGKQNLQNDQVSELIDGGCDILCVNLVDRTDATMIIDKARNAEVPVIFFNRELVQEDLERWDQLYYVGAETLESGILQGEIVASLCTGENTLVPYDYNGDGKLQYVMLEGEAGHQDALLRTEYSLRTIGDAGISLEKLGDEIANWNRAQAQTKMKSWIQEFGNEIELILANNDDMALGAIDAWKEAGKTRMPIVVGIDGTKEAFAAIQDGFMAGTVVNDAKGQAHGMVELAYALVCKTELPEDISLVDDTYIRLPHHIVTVENVKEDLEGSKKD